MLNKILPPKLYTALSYGAEVQKIEEIRLLVGAPMTISIFGKKTFLDKVSKSDVEYVIGVVTRNSIYATNDTLVRGYLTYEGGIRVGVCGESVVEDGKVKTVKCINGLVIRIPHDVPGIVDGVIDKVVVDEKVKNTLIVGAPLSGKTTMLREFSRVLSKKYLKSVVIIDEKSEISATTHGVSLLDVGYASVMVGLDRSRGIEYAVRNLAPEVIITDEVYGDSDVEAIKTCIRSGVSIIASMHGNAFGEFEQKFDYGIRLGQKPVGKILEARDL